MNLDIVHIILPVICATYCNVSWSGTTLHTMKTLISIQKYHCARSNSVLRFWKNTLIFDAASTVFFCAGLATSGTLTIGLETCTHSITTHTRETMPQAQSRLIQARSATANSLPEPKHRKQVIGRFSSNRLCSPQWEQIFSPQTLLSTEIQITKCIHLGETLKPQRGVFAQIFLSEIAIPYKLFCSVSVPSEHVVCNDYSSARIFSSRFQIGCLFWQYQQFGEKLYLRLA